MTMDSPGLFLSADCENISILAGSLPVSCTARGIRFEQKQGLNERHEFNQAQAVHPSGV